MKRSGLIAMIALSMLPLVVTGLAVLFVLPETIPLHAGVNGIDRVGPKYEAFTAALIMTGCGVLCTIAYAFMDKLAAVGLVHGTNAHGGRVVLLFTQIFMNVILLLALAWMTFGLK